MRFEQRPAVFQLLLSTANLPDLGVNIDDTYIFPSRLLFHFIACILNREANEYSLGVTKSTLSVQFFNFVKRRFSIS